LCNWTHWLEPIGGGVGRDKIQQPKPVEQTQALLQARIWSDYVWYETSFTVQHPLLQNATLVVQTQKSNSLVVFLNDDYAGEANHHDPGEGDMTLSIRLGSLRHGTYQLAILSESLGYFNLVGNDQYTRRQKKKGITGSVLLKGGVEKNQSYVQQLVDGRMWNTSPGLGGSPPTPRALSSSSSSAPGSCGWSRALFETPDMNALRSNNEALFLDVTMGRGHVWLNGRDLGRYWNITRPDRNGNSVYSQRTYLFPPDLLNPPNERRLNEVLFFNALGAGGVDLSVSTKLVVSGIEPDPAGQFEDEVDFAQACI